MNNLAALGIGALWTLVVGGVGAYFGAYLKKKGENYATREDVAELTRITKEIEAKISDEVWNRQRQWEFKRDVLLQAAKGLAACHGAIVELAIAFKATGGSEGLTQNRVQRSREWTAASSEFSTSTRMLVDLVCEKESRVAFAQFGELTRDIACETMDGDPEAFTKAARDFRAKYAVACNALRKELGVGGGGLELG
jgi:hypothetical protein